MRYRFPNKSANSTALSMAGSGRVSFGLSPLGRAVRAVRAVMLGLPLLTIVPGAVSPAQAQNAEAQSATNRTYSIGAGPLSGVLTQFAAEAGIQLSVDASLTAGLASPGVNGPHSVSSALAHLLEGTGLEAVDRGHGEYTLRRAVLKGKESTLATVKVVDSAVDTLPAPYAGGQVARGSRSGVLGNMDFMNMPFNSTAYTSATIENQHTRTLAEAVVNDPSVRITGGNGNLSDEFIIRGFPVDNKDVSFDGLYGVLPAYRTGIEYAERIEVLKGATSFLNGMAPIGSIGGTINVVPKRAGDKPLTRLTTSYATRSKAGLHADVGRRFGENQEYGIRFNGAGRNGDGAIDDQSEASMLASLGLDYRGQRLRLSADLIGQREKLDGIQHVLSVTPGFRIPDAPDGRNNLAQPWYHGDRKAKSAMVAGEYDFTDNLTAYLRGGHAETTNYVVGAGGGFTLLNAAGDTRMYDSLVRFKYKTRTVDGGLRSKFTTGNIGHSVALGGTWYQQVSERYMDIIRNPAQFSNIYHPIVHAKPRLTDGSPGKEADIRLTSFSLSDTLSAMDDSVQLTLGVRHQRVVTDKFLYTTGQHTSSYDETADTPMVGLIIKPWDNVSFYGNYIEGLSAGERAPEMAANAGEVFEPYKSKQYEAGVKVDHGSFATTLSAFQLSKPSGGYVGNTNVYAQSNEQRNRGIEINLFGEPVPGIRLLGGVMFNRALITRTPTGLNEDNHAPGTPRMQLNIGSEWDIGALPGLTLSAQAVHTSRQYVDAANLQSIPEWTRWDAGARYSTRLGDTPTVFRLYVHNLFDKDYWAGTSIWGPGLYTGLPRTLNLSASFDF